MYGVQSERRHHAQRAEQINRQIRRRIRIRRIARAEQIGERGHDRNHREAQAKPCERGRALPRDFADIDTVNYIIEQIEHLRDEHGRGKRQRFAAHAALGKVDLPGRLFLFQTGPSFLLTFCHIFTDSDLL